MIQITPQISIPEEELRFDFIRSSRPGGQNINKVATGVQLRFNVRTSSGLPEEVRERLLAHLSSRLTSEGELVIEARRFRTQQQNREDALNRLTALLARAAEPPRPRHRTRPTRASQARRLAEKRRRGEIKRLRGRAGLIED